MIKMNTFKWNFCWNSLAPVLVSFFFRNLPFRNCTFIQYYFVYNPCTRNPGGGGVLKFEGFKYFTSLYLNMGYYHIRLSTYGINLCTIILPWGKYKYKRLTIGLYNSPSFFMKKWTNHSKFYNTYCMVEKCDQLLSRYLSPPPIYEHFWSSFRFLQFSRLSV